MRTVTGMQKTHLVLHAPQGDTYADLLFTMIERRNHRPPVTFTTFQARDLGSDTANLFKQACLAAYERYKPELLLVGASCTAELIQDDPGGLAEALGLPIPVVALELPSYQRKENFGADETFFQIVKALATECPKTDHITCNLIGPTALGFRHRDDIRELTHLLSQMGIAINAIAPMHASPDDIKILGAAHFNVLMYPETGETACRWMEKNLNLPFTKTIPIGLHAVSDFIQEIQGLVDCNTPDVAADMRSDWYSASVDSNYLTKKRVFVFGDGTHAMAAARLAQDEMGFQVVGLGCYNREQARPLRAMAKMLDVPALISDDYLEIEDHIKELAPELILGTQMERHIAKRLGIPCAVISAPVHVQDFPARYSPQMGIEGANVIFDTWVHPLVMGLEEHLLHMFRDDFEFNDTAGPSHHGGSHQPAPQPEIPADDQIIWLDSAEKELKKIPFFVRGKARRNTEKFATSKGLYEISIDTLYEAKAHYAQ
jgi:light-independent protochlorophyllide reductase subunit B